MLTHYLVVYMVAIGTMQEDLFVLVISHYHKQLTNGHNLKLIIRIIKILSINKLILKILSLIDNGEQIGLM